MVLGQGFAQGAENPSTGMSTLHCFGCAFQIDSPKEFELLLMAKGFELSPPVEDSQILASFRLEPKGRFYDLHQGEARVSSSQTLALLSEIVSTRLHLLVSSHCPDYTFLRGDVVESPQGEALLLAGSTFTGKTRLARALIQSGAKPWSQHYAVLDQSGLVFPYPHAEKPSRGLKLGAVLHVPYHPGSQWSVTPSSPGQATLHLVPLVVGNEEAVPQALPRLSVASTGARMHLMGRRGAAEQAAEALVQSEIWLQRSKAG